jgi:hypothetical protein
MHVGEAGDRTGVADGERQVEIASRGAGAIEDARADLASYS